MIDLYNLIQKRKHVRKYREDKIPEKTDIEEILWLAWKCTPSKNNFMPYQVNVLGPYQDAEKLEVWKMSVMNHDKMETEAKEKGINTVTQAETNGPDWDYNPDYKHVKHNPYLCVITARCCDEPNEYYKMQEKTGHFCDQTREEYVERIIDTTCVEVGLFINHATMFAVDKGIDVSYTSCFPRQVKHWHKSPYVKWRPIILMSFGYGEIYRQDVMKEDGYAHMDIKPEMDKVIQWI